MRETLGATLIFTFLHCCARADDFTDANKAFAAGNYADAKRGYERTLAQGWRANVLHNLGNAAFRLDEKGRAALAYERALLLDPTHPDALANLRHTRKATAASGTPATWRERAEREAFRPFTFWAILGTGWAGLVFTGVALWRRRRGVAFWFGLILFIGAGAGLGALQILRSELRATAIVIPDKADARTEPADRAGLAGSFMAGTRVRVISAQGDWIYAELPGGGRGWFAAGAVERIVPGEL